MIPTLEYIAAVVQHFRRLGFPDALVVGGCLRDIAHGLPIKDVNVLISCQGDDLQEKLGKLGLDFKLVCRHGHGSLQVNTTWESVNHVDWPIQVLELCPGRSPLSSVSKLDFGMSQVCYDGTCQRFTTDFKLDYMLDCFTLVSCESQQEFNWSMQRWESLKLRYPDCKLVIFEQHERFQV